MKKLVSFGFASLLMLGSMAQAQTPVLAEMYGRGVHQYFAGDLISAHQSLTLAIGAGSEDPRAYYFRGLVNSATGREDEAKADWRMAAKLETTSPMAGLVGQSLRRVQGNTRLQLEMVRQQVKLEERGGEQLRAQARVQELSQAETQVLRPKTPAARPAPSRAAPAADAVAGAAASPFGEPGAAAPAMVAEDVHTDPFKDDQPGGAAGAGAAPAANPADAFGAEPAMSGADPFGGGGGTAPSTPPPGNMPDPFGGSFGSGT